MNSKLIDNGVDVTAGAVVREKRLASGITQATLAEAASVSYQQMQKYESGVNRISISKFVLIARALNSSAESFMREIEARLPG